jgi:hypothetical protein
MQTDEKLGTFAAIIEPHSAEVQAIARALRTLIIDIDPDTYEVPRNGDRSTTYGVGPSKMKQSYCYIMPQKDYVNLGFYQGVSLADDEGLLEGTGKALRHVKVRSLNQVQSPAVRKLIVAAVQERQANEAAKG